MSVAFPSGYNLERSTPFTDDLNIAADIMDDGSSRARVLGDLTYTTIEAQFRYLSEADMLTLVSFLKTNRAEEITWTVDGIDYIGRIISTVKRTMTGAYFNVSFTYHATEA